MHYQRLRGGREVGSANARKSSSGAIETWIRANVTTSVSDCMFLPAAEGKEANRIRGVTINGKRKIAHRFMCELAHGEAPRSGLDVAHGCGNGHLGCINPNHLRWATRLENVADMVLHGTKVVGERKKNAKLTEAIVREIRDSELPDVELARLTGVTPRQIGKIRSRLQWAHVA